MGQILGNFSGNKSVVLFHMSSCAIKKLEGMRRVECKQRISGVCVVCLFVPLYMVRIR